MTFASVADETNLYFAIMVTDAHIIAGQHEDFYWNEDSVELYLNASGDTSLTAYTPSVVQITIPAVNIGLPVDKTILAGINWGAVNPRVVVVKTETGYAIEAAVSLHNAAWNIVPQQDGTLGFQIQMNSASQVDRDVKLSWSNADKTEDQSHLNPSVFGQLVFYSTTPVAAAEVHPSTSGRPTAAPTTPATEAPATTVAMQAGNGFAVQGSQIIGPDGNPFIVKGVNVNGFNWVWPRRTVDDIDLITNCWNFNLVRVNSFLFGGMTKYQQYTTNNDLDEIVRAFTERQIVVVFEGHDYIGGYYQGDDLEKLVTWFRDLATKYRDNPYVWFDVMNEPGGRRSLDVDQWVNVHGRVVQAIRDDADADNIIIVEGAFGGQDAGNKDASPVSDSAILQHGEDVIHFNGRTFENIAFSIHTYDLWNQGDAKLVDFLDRVEQKGYPMIIGEYGVYTDQDVTPAATSLFNVGFSRNIGRIVWQWDGGDANDLTSGTSQGGGWEINDCQNPTNLSWLGQQVWSDNHAG